MSNGRIEVSIDDGTATLWCMSGKHGTEHKLLMIIPHATDEEVQAGIVDLEQGGLAGKYAPLRVGFGPDDSSSEEEYQAWLKASDVPEGKECPQCEGQGKTAKVTGYVTGEMALDAGELEMITIKFPLKRKMNEIDNTKLGQIAILAFLATHEIDVDDKERPRLAQLDRFIANGIPHSLWDWMAINAEANIE